MVEDAWAALADPFVEGAYATVKGKVRTYVLHQHLLAHLAARAGTVVSKKDLLADVWHAPYGGADKTVDVHLSWLRRKLGESASAPRYLHSVRGVGVKLVAPDGAGT